MATKKGRQTSKKTIQTVKRELSRKLLQNPAVSGVGIENSASGDEQIKVYLAEDNSTIRALVPKTVEGYPVVIETTGPIHARLEQLES